MSFDDTVLPWTVHNSSVSLARQVAYSRWVSTATKYLRTRAADAAAHPLVRRTPPPFESALTAHAAPALVGWPDDPPGAPRGMPRPGFVRLSLYGDGVGAGIIGYSSVLPVVFSALYANSLGRYGLFLKPYWPVRRNSAPPNDGRTADERRESRQAAIFGDVACDLCGSAAADDVAHLCTTCPVTAARRDAALGNGAFAAHVSTIVEAIYTASGGRLNRVDLLTRLIALPVDTAEAHFITSRIITGSPWPLSAADPTWHVAGRLGKSFDADIPKPQAAKVANVWALAAHAISTTVCLRWWALLPVASRASLGAAGHIVPT